MAQSGAGRFCCSICVDLLKDPVTPACGHSFCNSCIKKHWDSEELKGVYSCPQCRETFTPRPELRRNIILAELLVQLQKTGLQAAPADHCYAGPEDVACDVCTGRKEKALKSCLVCLVSYCEKHLQPHYVAAPLKKHQLVEPCEKLQENICPLHDEVMKMFCRTDQQCICYLCSVDQHQGHDTVTATAERTERQKELEETRPKIQQRILDTEGNLRQLQQELEALRGSADGAMHQSEKLFTELILDLQKRRSEVVLQNPSHITAEVSRVRGQVQDMQRPQPQLQPELQPQPQPQQHPEPEIVSRADFLKYSKVFTLDPDTANSLLILSDGDRKVKSVTKNKLYPDHPDRFTGFLQVLSRESLTGQSYWEVEMKGLGVAVAVVHKDIARAGISEESAFGFNDKCWMLVAYKNNYFFQHNKSTFPVVSTGSSVRVGVYVDPAAGDLSFYKIRPKMTLITRINTTFTQPLHVGFRLIAAGVFGSKAKFCKL